MPRSPFATQYDLAFCTVPSNSQSHSGHSGILKSMSVSFKGGIAPNNFPGKLTMSVLYDVSLFRL